MSESPEELDSAEELNDDGQLTIRIPNPKMYMARQSQWKGRRGKPRCDHCRTNNLKCDRVLPMCNHCSWANGRECGYTPLPTPAHRGIPRCDRCRLRNLKCDRNLPICNHCAEEGDVECNYTPKKRHKVPSDHGAVRDKQMAPYGTKTASFLVSDMPSAEESPSFSSNGHGDSADGHSFYGQNVASSSHSHDPKGSLPNCHLGGESSQHPHSKTPDSSGQPWASTSSLLSSPRQLHISSRISFISHSFPSDQGMIVTKPLVESWAHPLFAPLPDVIIQRISNINSVEMPNRALFEDTFSRFLDSLPFELLETAAFTPEVYAAICRSLSGNNSEDLSDHLRMWTVFHHVRLGSERYHLLLVPRDAVFPLEATEEEKLRRDYTDHIDSYSKDYREASLTISPSKPDIVNHDFGGFEWARAFERIPVRNQIYDILVYAHRAHGSSTSTLFETRRIGMATITWPMVEIFIRLCPLCTLRNKSIFSHSIKTDPQYGVSNDWGVC
ncbi:hypothetical protein PAXRUDRAFT_825162 [Paxillus rubicundulus Ve08.2h10]|uniref:Zn(2)-C6 fungal-type domain-containing protein n=1 Tax=Paxillus rubicundulus Ve08.2h10 TaxID=930991 RepID=A0A0D0DGR8_9AGAM|nr:hypothetical protein PAXRUDRAFT_825162 [Paxillus rubicundulus Ve08.2h10]